MPAPGKNAALARLRSATAIITALSLFVTQSAAYALPVGGQVVAGQAAITTGQNALTVGQSSNRAIVNWQGFNIANGETVNVAQPSAGSIELERVTGSGNPTQIMGSLASNGQVWLVNPNGVMFGSSAQVNVAGLVATSSDIDNSSFMNGNYSFTHPGNPNALISNAGNITISDNGLAALVGPNVTNTGLIQARLGKVALASGDTFALDLYGDGLINLQASSQITQQVVSNSGSIIADGGTVLLTAAAAQNAINSVINMDGLIQANSVGTQNGTITLYAEGSNAVQNNVAANKGQKQGTSEVLVSGTLDASGYGSGQTGGTIQVLGDHVGILAGSVIDASGDTGGGTLHIGGDFHGQGTTPTAQATIVESGANIKANAVTTGNGGNVTVWADNYTNFAGTIKAKSGALSGNGGFVETSGKQMLVMTGSVDASAPNGTAGIWLLDPNNLIINGSATANAGSGPAWTAASGGGNVLGTDINAALNGGTSVDLTASGSIEVAAGITKSAGSDASLTLAAGQDITIDTGIAIASTTGKLNVTLDADTALGGGAILMNSGSSITSNGGNITLGGGANPLTTAAVGDAASSGIGINLDAAILNASGGNISILGTGQSSGTDTGSAYGIEMQAGAQANTTGSGSVTLTGISGGSGFGAFDIGVYLTDSSTQVSVVNGALSITGTGGNTAGYADLGVYILSGTVQTTGNGALAITGYGGGSGGSSPYDHGIDISGTVTSTATGGGGITMIGYSGDNGGSTTETTYGTSGIVLLGATVSSVSGAIVLDGNTGNGHVVSNSSGSNYYGVAVEGGSAISSTGNATITLNGVGAGSGSSEYGIFTGVGGSSNVIGGASASGNIALNANTVSLTNFAAQTTGNVTIAPTTASTIIGVAGGAGTLAITSGILGDITAGSITIGNAADSGTMNVGSYAWANPLTLDSGSGNINITNGSGALAFTHALTINTGSGNVTLAATTDITNTAATNITTGVGGGTGGSVTFDADSGNGGSGAISIGAGNITSNGGNITLGGGSGAITGVVLNADGTVSTAASGFAYGDPSNVNGIYIGGTTVNSGGGNIIMNGIGATSAANSVMGVYNNGTIQSSGGTISIAGTGGSGDTGNNSGGIYNGSTIANTGTGNIFLLGIGSDSTGYDPDGIFQYGTIQGVDGTITLKGVGGANNVSAIGIRHYYLTEMTGTGTLNLIGQTVSAQQAGTFNIGTFSTNSGALNITSIGSPLAGYGGLDNNILSTTGNITITTDSFNLGNGAITTIRTGGNLTFKPYTTSTVVNVDNGSSGMAITSTILGAITAGSITIGSTSDTGTMTVGATTWSEPLSLISGSGVITIAGAQAMGANNFTLETNATPTFSSTVTTTGSIIIEPATASTPIGFSGGAGTLLITQAIMDDINAPTVTIGSLTDTGLLITGAFNWEHTLTALNLESGGAAGAVTIGGSITKGIDDGSVANTANGTLDVVAGADIIVNSNKAISSSSTYGQLNTIFDADYAGSGGAILMNSGSSINSNGGNITMGGGANPLTTAAVADAANPYAIYLDGSTLNAGAGSISLRGDANIYSAAIYANTALIETTSGDISLYAQTSVPNYTLNLTSTTVTTQSGNITLSSSIPHVACFNCLAVLLGGAGNVISSTGTGNVGAITITGSAPIEGPSNSYSVGVVVSTGTTISSVDANININGTISGTPNATLGVVNFGIGLGGGVITSTGAGNIVMTGVSDVGDALAWGLNTQTSTVSAHNGSITLQGTGSGSGYEGLLLSGNVTSTGTAPITLTGTGTNGASDIGLGNTIGGASDTGAVTLNANTLDGTLTAIQTTGNVAFAPRTASTTIGIAGGAGTLSITSGMLGDITAGSLTIGSTADSGKITIGTQTLPANELIQTGSGNIEFSGAQTDGTKTLTAVTGSGNITLDQNAKIASTASGNAIVLADSGGNFINNDSNDGASALSTPDGRWLVYSNNPLDNTLNGLSASFNRYFCTYGGTCPSFSPAGDGLLYSLSDFPVTSYTVDSNVNLTAYSPTAATAEDRAAQAATPISHLLTFDMSCGQSGGSADAFTANCQGDDGR